VKPKAGLTPLSFPRSKLRHEVRGRGVMGPARPWVTRGTSPCLTQSGRTDFKRLRNNRGEAVRHVHGSKSILEVDWGRSIRGLCACLSGFASTSNTAEPFHWSTNDLVLSFEVTAGRLRQKRVVPAGAGAPVAGSSSGVEVALQCSGEDSGSRTDGAPGSHIQPFHRM